MLIYLFIGGGEIIGESNACEDFKKNYFLITLTLKKLSHCHLYLLCPYSCYHPAGTALSSQFVFFYETVLGRSQGFGVPCPQVAQWPLVANAPIQPWGKKPQTNLGGLLALQEN